METKPQMEKHFVTFLSPGTFVPEESTKPIDSWDVKEALKLAKGIKERYAATPYAFYFTTRSREENDLDSKEAKRSGNYYLPHCKVETLEEVKKRADPNERILLSNMECNGWHKIVTTMKGWKFTRPFEEKDVLLEYPS